MLYVSTAFPPWDFLRLRIFPPVFLTANFEEKMGGAQVSALTGTAPAAW